MKRYGLIGMSVCLALTGCGVGGGTTVFTGGPNGTTNWSEPLDAGKASPFDSGTVCYAGTTVVVWVNESVKGSGMKVNHGHDGIRLEGYLRFADEKRVEVKGESKDGKSGTVTIAAQRFELADGNLFLVVGPSDRPRVKQLNRDLSGVDFKDRKSLQAFGTADTDMTAFFTQK